MPYIFCYKKHLKTIGQILFVTVFIFFSTPNAESLEKYNKAKNIADYFSGILLLNQSKYSDSFKYLKKLDGLEESHSSFASKYLYSLVNSGNFHQAFNFSKKLEKLQRDSFESNLIIGVYYLKNAKNDLAKKYFTKAKKNNFRTLLDSYLIETLIIWSNINELDLEKAELSLNNLDNRFENLKKIQNVFFNCFFENDNTESEFYKLVSNDKTDFSRYNYFYANYLKSINKKTQAVEVINSSLEKFPRNLLINQYKDDLETSKISFRFDCKKEKDVAAELIYIAANALSSQSVYPLSNFYLNLSKYLNKDFHAFDTLLAENYYNIDDLNESKKIYKKLVNHGRSLKWYSEKQISRILIQEKKKDESLEFLKKSFNELPLKGIYETFDYAEFLKNNEQYENSIKFYTEVLKKININHPLFPEATDGRGVAFERIGEWEKAEKDLLNSLKVSPNQAYVINYLAYSWIEQGVKIEKSLKMLEKANKLKSNDPYIIDSLGWALFKLKRYEESKNYLQLAVRLMPADPIVNDHFGDVLWKNGNEIQARYYWNYVLNLEKTEEDLKVNVKKKLIKGL